MKRQAGLVATTRIAMLAGLGAVLGLAACGTAGQATPTGAAATPGGPRTLTVMTHDSFAVSEAVQVEFESAHHVTVQFLKSGDTAEALGKAILARGQPLADVFYGVDNTFLSVALKEDIFEVYASPLLAEIPDEFELDPGQRALPVDYGDICLNYDKAYFSGQGIAPPARLEDLTRPEYRDLLVVENPAASSPGLGFLLATVGHFGDPGYVDYWAALRDNGVLVVNDWETAYYTEFSGSSGQGARPIVVSYGSSPPAEVLFAETPLDDAPTAAVTGPGSCFRQIEFVGILRGTANRDLAEAWVDFMLSPRFQADMPLQMFVLPVNPNAALDPTFEQYMAMPEAPIVGDPEEIAQKREAWIEAWTEVVLR
ncbi:MAG: thiamine ABC transporter substrate-binding protein [Anaerolineales bacterium]|nr:thiamine ABC transporter substrate-binding protein [Anaerolineales bacterium]